MSKKKLIRVVFIIAILLISFVFFYDRNETERFSDSVETKKNLTATGYVLALSWSPTYCLQNQSKPGAKTQCDPNDLKKYRFIIHGLWPNAPKKRLGFCKILPGESDYVSPKNIQKLFHFSPSASLIGHQWRKHGTCSGLKQDSYIEKTLAAYQRFRPPAFYQSLTKEKRIDAAQVKADFIDEYQKIGLTNESVRVVCDGNHLREVRICTDLELNPVTCSGKSDFSCERKKLILPPAL